MFTDKNFIIFLFLLIPAVLGGVIYLFTVFMADKVHKLPKSPDEFENLIILEAKKNMTSYWISSLVIINFFVLKTEAIERRTISVVIVGLLFCGVVVERLTMKMISRKYLRNQ
jgi:hypothetical protein